MLLVCRVWVCQSLDVTHDLMLKSCRLLACWHTFLSPGPSYPTAIHTFGLIKCSARLRAS